MGRKTRTTYRPYNHSVSPASSWEQKVFNDLKDVAEIERLEPIGAPSWTRHLAMALSVAGCLALSVFVGVLVVMLKQHFSFEIAVGDAGFWAGLTFAITLFPGILLAAVDFRGGLVSIERILGRDLDGDGQVGKPEALRAMIVRGGQRESAQELEDESGEPPDQLVRFGHFCLECLRTGTIARSTATTWRLQPNGAHGSPKVSRTEWEAWRGWFEAAGLLDDLGSLRAGLIWGDIEGVFPDLGGQAGDGRAGAHPPILETPSTSRGEESLTEPGPFCK